MSGGGAWTVLSNVDSGHVNGLARNSNPRARPLQDFSVGQHVEGVVMSVRRSGSVWIDVGAVRNGCLPAGSAQRSQKQFNVGDRVEELKVGYLDLERSSLGLRLRQYPPRPAARRLEEFSVGQRVEGVVKSVAPNGSVWIDVGTVKDACLPSGAAHLSQEAFKVGAWAKGLIVGYLDVKESSLGLRMVRHPDGRPLHTFSEGERVDGMVQEVTDCGAFIDIGADRDGFLSEREMTDRGRILKVGDRIDDLVTGTIELERHRITLHLTGGFLAKGGASSRRSGRPWQRQRWVAVDRGSGQEGNACAASSCWWAGWTGNVWSDSAWGGKSWCDEHRLPGSGSGCRDEHPTHESKPYAIQLKDFRIGQHVKGVVTSVGKSGSVWIDVGAVRDGCLPAGSAQRSQREFKVGDHVEDLKVGYLDLERSSLGLRLLHYPPRPSARPLEEFSIGQRVEGVVKSVAPNGSVWIDVGTVKDACLSSGAAHLSRDDLRVGSWATGLIVGYLDVEEGSLGLRVVRHPDGRPLHSFCDRERVGGIVQEVTDCGAFIDIGADRDGFLPEREMSDRGRVLKAGDRIDNLFVGAIETERHRITLHFTGGFLAKGGTNNYRCRWPWQRRMSPSDSGRTGWDADGPSARRGIG